MFVYLAWSQNTMHHLGVSRSLTLAKAKTMSKGYTKLLLVIHVKCENKDNSK